MTNFHQNECHLWPSVCVTERASENKEERQLEGDECPSSSEIRWIPPAGMLTYLSSAAGINRRCPLAICSNPLYFFLFQSEESFRTDRCPQRQWNSSRLVLLGWWRRNRWMKGHTHTMSLHVFTCVFMDWIFMMVHEVMHEEVVKIISLFLVFNKASDMVLWKVMLDQC